MPVHSAKVPPAMQPHYQAITALTDEFCNNTLNSQEYLELARYVTAALCRKRLSPLLQGKATTWACAIIYALGFVNFLFDKSTPPYISAKDLAAAFGISLSTASSKAKQVKNLLKMYQFATRWCLPSLLERHPFAWMITVNGFIVDARTLPHDIQKIAFKKGLIPYLPKDNPSK